MKRSKNFYLILIALILAVYYIFVGVYLNKLGYTNHEQLFYIEKAKIVTHGIGNKLRVMGLTSPLLPFYGSYIFSFINNTLAPVLASAVGTALLFFMMANSLVKRNKDNFYLALLVILFTFHPGLIYTACSGKSTYMVLIFFYLFFLNMLRFYNSNTTYHISIASIFFVLLVFSDYKCVWLALFFIPLVLSISLHSLNLSEKEPVFRLHLSFNNPSLRRKLVNKTFSIYSIIFILPLASVALYKVLNLTHADDLNYFLDSPYATWNIIADQFEYSNHALASRYDIPEISILVSLKAIVFCPMVVLAIYLFKQNTYQILTLLTPFGLIEFLKVKYDKVNLVYGYYLLFLVLALLCIIFRARFIRNQNALKLTLVIVAVVQIYIGYIFLARSYIHEESHFVEVLRERTADKVDEQNREIADYLNKLGKNDKVLVDDAVAYTVGSYVKDITKLTLPYQESYLSAVEAPEKYDGYVLIANDENPMLGYTQLTDFYMTGIRRKNPKLNAYKIYVTDYWTLYRLLE
ncbi:hypothetical protein LLH06_19475 [Mucilaginibacter daejeonensis]|uniref:hypothetical protein n=1 Tax=Mucilaginibacter daejeonensis TaxID=398049 RepID=UPI001D170A1E|nr:hypothetical protein [Mucilaginibacter daejeonensis]UEG53129.1 hypothetical protein LLH06_19475 [Mucilaginibacter daejeonensis]